jgi:thiamine pyrophosphokinase
VAWLISAEYAVTPLKLRLNTMGHLQTIKTHHKVHEQRRNDTNLCIRSTLSGQGKRLAILGHRGAWRDAQLHQMWKT